MALDLVLLVQGCLRIRLLLRANDVLGWLLTHYLVLIVAPNLISMPLAVVDGASGVLPIATIILLLVVAIEHPFKNIVH